MLAAAGIDVAEGFTDEDLAAFVAGLDALPAPYRHVPTGRIRLVLDASLPPSASGIAEPEWRGDDFILTRQQGAANFRDASLPEGDRRHLWRARALVHALLSRWDDVHQWSRDARWRRTNGWLLPFERPLSLSEHALNQATTAYARPRGQHSSKLDLLTFAESALVPVESLPTDELVRCQEFTRARALGELLGTPWSPGACPAFDTWLRADELQHLEVLFVQASGRAPESLFGHLLVRPVWRSDVGPSFETAVQFVALTLPQLGPAHLARGLFGGYSIGVFTVSMTDLQREKLSGEQRSMTRWKLALSADERRRFMERTWELERRGRFAYAFFSDNCATVLVWMLETSLDEPTLARWPSFITSPGGLLDDLFRARKPSGERLLTQVFPTFESTGAIAQRDERRRRELEDRLNGLGVDLERAHASDVATRLAAYEAVAAASQRAPASLHADLFTWWALSARVERASADDAQHELRELDQLRIEPDGTDLEVLWQERLTAFERESTLQQQLMMLDRDTFFDDVRRRAKKRPLTRGEAETQRELEAKVALFSEVTRQQAMLGSEVFTAGSAQEFLAAEETLLLHDEVPPASASLPVSGHWRTGLGGGVWRGDDGRVRPVVRLEEAGLLELLGEQRARGLGARVGVRALEGGLTFSTTTANVPEVVQSHFTLVAFDSLAPPVPPVPRWQEHLGFGFDLGTDFRKWRSVPQLSEAQGWLFLGAHGDHARNLLALGVGPALAVGADALGVEPLGGGTARLVARLGLLRSGPSGVRLDVRYQSLFGPRTMLHELRADASVEWVVSWADQPRLIIRPTVALSAEPVRSFFTGTALLVLEPAVSLVDLH